MATGYVMKLKLMSVALLCIVSGSANAEPSAKDTLQAYDISTGDTKELFQTIIMSTTTGISWGNIYGYSNGKPIYCMPFDKGLDYNEVIALLRSEITKNPEVGEKPLGLGSVDEFAGV